MSVSPEAIDPLADGQTMPDTKWGVPGYVYSLETEDLERDGVRVERLLHRSRLPVQAGGGVRADTHNARPHVEYVLGEPSLTLEARQRLAKNGYHLIRGEITY